MERVSNPVISSLYICYRQWLCFLLLPARKQPGLTQTCLGSGGSFVLRVSAGCAAFCAQGQPGQGWTLLLVWAAQPFNTLVNCPSI